MIIGSGIRYMTISDDPTPLIRDSDTSSITSLSTATFFAGSIPDATGKQQPLKQWQGKITVVNFWASWCSPCREEMPDLSSLYQDYEKQGLVVLGIAMDDVEKIREFSQKTSVSYPLLAADEKARELSIDLGNDKGAVPYTVIIDRNGKIIKTYIGRINRGLIEPVIKSLIAPSSTNENTAIKNS